ncbi:alpha/beta fold hydrolase [Bowmanella dokdonensis]|uniref:Alpha/beta hydrolase n=1 Tax=Bowmanella dokdonensis TaxID=751969 RepID=A0A939DR30_9ALTE|nr:alpha/beta hydrolase [Bowmanella dokdonensis]MBN7827184.1 alpha/beta hydrolase [Bowmanella dokdonensis]
MFSLQEWQSQGQVFHFEGHEIFYRTDGDKDKPVLLLIHGFPSSSWDWRALWPELVQHFRLISLDLLGFGFSDKPKHYVYSLKVQARLCIRLLEKERVRRVNLLAHDYGDTVAQELLSLAREPGGPTIDSAMLFNGGLFPETHQPLLIQKMLLSPFGGLVARLISYASFERNFDRICAVPLKREDIRGYWQLLQTKGGKRVVPRIIQYMKERELFRTRWVGALQHPPCPVRLINGIADPISGKNMLNRYRELVVQPDVVELADVGHYPHLEAPQLTLEAALAFWRAHHIL